MQESSLQPHLQSVKLASLRPTQMTVGLREVERKRQSWANHKGKKRAEFLGRHMIPVVIGPKKELWVVDHHHLALALHKEGVEKVLVSVVARLDQLSHEGFLTYMDNRNWLHPFDEKSQRHTYDAIPRTLAKLIDDPYRSLAGELRRSGGYAKVSTPYAEFLWADFLREHIKPAKLEKAFDDSIKRALIIAKTDLAKHLPGWSGISLD